MARFLHARSTWRRTWLALRQAGGLAEEEDDAEGGDEGDELDFGMI